MLFISGLLSSMPSNTLARLSATALMWHAVVIVTMTLLVPMIAPYYQSASFVWTKFYDVTHSDSGITSNLYLFMQVLLPCLICLHSHLFLSLLCAIVQRPGLQYCCSKF